MGIFDRFNGQSGNQTEEEQQDASQPTGGQFSDQSGQGGMQTAQNTIGQQGGPQDSGMGGYQDLDEKASQYHVTRLPDRAADAAGQPGPRCVAFARRAWALEFGHA
jgi:hypothetical protein